MNDTASLPAPRPFAVSPRIELAAVLLLAAAVFLSIPWSMGRVGLSWDALNHHIYLGWAAEGGRFDKDYLASNLQATQFPYLYWPVYKLAMANVSGVVAGSVLALLHLLAVPPAWWVARLLLPQEGLAGVGLRVAAVALGFMSAVPLKTLEATGNDLLVAIPVLWAVAFALHATVATAAPASRLRAAVVAGLFAGAAVACKFSNGPLVILLPLVFAFAADPWSMRVQLAVRCAIATLVGFAVTYGYWGWHLWQTFGNPMYPFVESVFAPLRAATGWTP
ncbi:MAG TPA: hypothetical protein VHL79_00105 [Ramlibacter sp.]|jgi:hypothetical protein|nr:hypothetical protein [Ramlibacter sp.]